MSLFSIFSKYLLDSSFPRNWFFSIHYNNLLYSCNAKGYTSWALAILVGNVSGQPEKVSVNTNRYQYSHFLGSSVKLICYCCSGPLPFPVWPISGLGLFFGFVWRQKSLCWVTCLTVVYKFLATVSLIKCLYRAFVPNAFFYVLPLSNDISDRREWLVFPVGFEPTLHHFMTLPDLWEVSGVPQ